MKGVLTMLERITNFDYPTQVKFWDEDGARWIGGIGFKDIIICGCCGATIEIEEIYDSTPSWIDNPIKIYKNWLNISSEIKGTADITEEDGVDE